MVFALAALMVLTTVLAAIPAFATEATYQFKVGETEMYADIDSAIEASAASGEPIVLLADTSINVKPFLTFTVDKAGYALAVSVEHGYSVKVLENRDGTVTVASYKDQGEKISAMDLALSGTIALRLYFTDLGVLATNDAAYMQVTVPQKNGVPDRIIKAYADDFTVDPRGRYMLSVNVAAAQQTDVIKFQIVNGSQVGRLYQYAIKDYSDVILANPERYPNSVEPVKTVLNYGAKAQEFFEHNVDDLANAGIYVDGTNPVYSFTEVYESIGNAAKTQGKNIMTKSVDAVLESDTGLKFKFAVSGLDINNATATIECDDDTISLKKQEVKITEESDGIWQVAVYNIPAYALDANFAVTVTCDGQTASYTASVLHYIQAVLDSDSATEEQKNVVTALYQYYLMMKTLRGEAVEKPVESTCAHSDANRRYQEITKAPTCTETGTYVEKCSDCGASLSTGTLPANSNGGTHDKVARSAKEATCTTEGWEAYYECADCGALFITTTTPADTEVDSVPVIEKLSHEYGAWAAPENVDGEWVEVAECSSCKAEIKRPVAYVVSLTVNDTVVAAADTAKYTSYNFNEVAAAETLALSGYVAINGGVSEYVYSIGGGDWTTITAEPSADAFESVPANAQKLGIVNYTAGSELDGLTVTLPASDSTMSIVIAAIPAANENAIIPFATIYNVKPYETATVCEHTNTKYVCDENGHTKVCTNLVCGATVEATAAHVYTDYEGTAPTTTKAGNTNYMACACGYTVGKYTIAATNAYENANLNLYLGAEDIAAAYDMSTSKSGRDYFGSNGMNDVELMSTVEDGKFARATVYSIADGRGFFYPFFGLTNDGYEFKPTGKYFIMKYRVSEDNAMTAISIFTRTTEGVDDPLKVSATGANDYFALKPVGDGWQTVVIDLEQAIERQNATAGDGKFAANALGEYVLNYFRLTFTNITLYNEENGYDDYVDIAYIGFTDTLEKANAYAPDKTMAEWTADDIAALSGLKSTSSAIGLLTDAENDNMPYVKIFKSANGESTVELTSSGYVTPTGRVVAVMYRFPEDSGYPTSSIEVYQNSGTLTQDGTCMASHYPTTEGRGTWQLGLLNFTNTDWSQNIANPTFVRALRWDYFNKAGLTTTDSTMTVTIGGVEQTITLTKYTKTVDGVSTHVTDDSGNPLYRLPWEVDVAYIKFFDTVADARAYYDAYVLKYGIGECKHTSTTATYTAETHTLTCNTCGTVTVDKAAHSFPTNATTTANGYALTCEDCGYTYEKAAQSNELLDWYIPATEFAHYVTGSAFGSETIHSTEEDGVFVRYFGNGSSSEIYSNYYLGSGAARHEGGRYFVVKYRFGKVDENGNAVNINADSSYIPLKFEMYINTTGNGAADGVGMKTSVDNAYLGYHDSDWHVLVVDLEQYLYDTMFAPETDGSYMIGLVRLDIDGGGKSIPAVQYTDIAYMGFVNDIDTAFTFDGSDYVIYSNKVDGSYYPVTTTLTADKTLEIAAGTNINVPDNAIKVPNGFVMAPFDIARRVSAWSGAGSPAETLGKDANANGMPYVRYTFTAGETGGEAYTSAIGSQISYAGSYLGILYRGSNGSSMDFFVNSAAASVDGNKYRNNTTAAYITEGAPTNFKDEQWHYQVIDLSALLNTDSTTTDDDYLKLLRFDINGIGANTTTYKDFAFMGFFDSADAARQYGMEYMHKYLGYYAEDNTAYEPVVGEEKEAVWCELCAGTENAHIAKTRDTGFVTHIDYITDASGNTFVTSIQEHTDYGLEDGFVTLDGDHLYQIQVGGWNLISDGADRYVYKVNDGEWREITTTDSSWNAEDKIDERQISTYYASIFNAGPNARYRVYFDLSDYVGETVKVTLGVVPANNIGARVALYTLNNVTVCDHEYAYTDNADGSTHTRSCSICGCTLAEAEAHSYEYTDNGDLATHTSACECGYKITDAAHTAGEREWRDNIGYATWCTICDGQSSEAVPFNKIYNHNTLANVAGFNYAATTETHTVGSSYSNSYVTYTTDGVTAQEGFTVVFSTEQDYAYGKYFVMKYKASSGYYSTIQVWANTETAAHNSGTGTDRSPKLVRGTTDWQYIVLDLDVEVADGSDYVNANENGEFIYKYFRIDLVDTASQLPANETFDIAYFAFCDSLEKVAMAVGNDTKNCAHNNTNITKTEFYKKVDLGDGTHGYVCEICGYQKSSEAHTLLNVQWNGKSYDNLCACGCVIETTPLNVIRYADFLSTYKGANNAHSGTYTLETDTDGTEYLHLEGSGDKYFSVFTDNETVETGQYLILKYRIPSDSAAKSLRNFIASTDADGGADGDDQVHFENVKADDKWHVEVFDLDSYDVLANYGPAEDGKYYTQFVRLGMNATGTIKLDIAYFGLCDSLENIAAFVQAEGDVDICTHSNKVGVTDERANDNYCQFDCLHCGKLITTAYHNLCESLWNAETEQYEATCADCGHVIVTEMANNLNVYVTPQSIQYKASVDSSGTKTNAIMTEGEGENAITFTRIWGTNTSDMFFKPYGLGKTNVTGQYYVMKYRLGNNEGCVNSNIQLWSSTTNTDHTSGDGFYVDIDGSGEWHTIVVDLAKAVTTNMSFTAADDGSYSAKYIRLNLFYGNTASETNYIDIAYVGLADSLDDIIASSDDTLDGFEFTASHLNGKLGGTLNSENGMPYTSIEKTVAASSECALNIQGDSALYSPNAFNYGALIYRTSNYTARTVQLYRTITAGVSDTCRGDFTTNTSGNWDIGIFNFEADSASDRYSDVMAKVFRFDVFNGGSAENAPWKMDIALIKFFNTEAEAHEFFAEYVKTYKLAHDCQAGAWTAVEGVAKEVSKCIYCDIDMERDVKFKFCMSGVSDAEQYINESSNMPTTVKTYQMGAVDNVLTIGSSWIGVNSGVNNYYYRVNGGAWVFIDWGEKVYNSEVAVETAVKGTYPDFVDVRTNGRFSGPIDLSAYAGQEDLTVELAFAPNNNTSIRVPFAIFTGIDVKNAYFINTLDSSSITSSEEQQTVTMTVDVKRNPGIAGMTIAPTLNGEYITDASAITVASVSAGSGFTATYDNSIVVITENGDNCTTDDVTVVTITFNVPANIEAGTYKLGVDFISDGEGGKEPAWNAAGTSVVVRTVNYATLTVTAAQ